MSEPTSKDYSVAFFAMEEFISRMEQAADVASFLAGSALEHQQNGWEMEPYVELTCKAVFTLKSTIKEAEAAYYASFNRLCDKENAALAKSFKEGKAA